MMNGVVLILVALSLTGAGLWSPAPANSDAVAGDHRRPAEGGPGNVVREGHRLIIVEYERESPQPRRHHPPPLEGLSAVVEEAKEKVAEAVAVMPNLGQGISSPLVREEDKKEEEKPSAHRTKEMICDAYGVCKEKIAELFGKSKEKAARAEEAAKEAVGGAAKKAKQAEEEAVEKVWRTEMKAEEKAKEIKKNVTEKAQKVKKNLTEIVHRARDVVYDAATFVCTAETAASAAAVAHLLGFATAYGTCVWVSFVSSHVLAGALSRNQFGILQSKLYPVYFQAMAYTVGLAGLTATERAQRYLLFSTLALVLLNLLFLEPKAAKFMFEKMKMEREEGRGRDMAELGTGTTTSTTATATATFSVTRTTVNQDPLTDKDTARNRIDNLDARLRALNTYSSFVNVISLMALSWHLVHLARRLQGSCEPVGAR